LYKHGSKGVKAASVEPLKRLSPLSGQKDDLPNCFHFSIGWQLEAPNDRQLGFEGIDYASLKAVKNIRVQIDSVKVKIGNTITSVMLQRSILHDRSILS